MERLRKKLDDNRISLNEDVRRHEVDEQKARKEARSKERLARQEEEPNIYRVTLGTIDAPKLELIMYPGKIAEAKSKGGMKVAPARRVYSSRRGRSKWGAPATRRKI